MPVPQQRVLIRFPAPPPPGIPAPHEVVTGGGPVTANGEYSGAPLTRQLSYIGDWFVLPHWAVALGFAALPGLVLQRLVRGCKRLAQGLCCHCGYDMHASPGRL